MMIWLIVAGMSPDHIVINHFNAYGEYYTELIMGIIMTAIILVGFIIHLQRFKNEL